MVDDDIRAFAESSSATIDEHLHLVRDPELRSGLVELFVRAQEIVDREGFNLVVLTARRIACIYQLLVSVGMPPLQNCLVVSDRFLDTRPALDWETRRALILDDSIVVGTTLTALSHRLEQQIATPGAVRSLTLCLDREQRAVYLLQSIRFETLFERSSGEVRAFSEDLVKMLFENQIPFFSDFPVTRPLEFQADRVELLLDTPDWDVADVTAPLLGSPTRRALSLIPSDDTFRRVLARLTPEVRGVVDGFKVRLYFADMDDVCSLVVVPLGLIAPSTPADLALALESISATASARGNREVLGRVCETWRPEAKHRLVQLYLSACVLAEFWPAAAAVSDRPEVVTGVDLDRLQTDLYFGPWSSTVLNAFDRVVKRYGQAPVGQAEALLSTSLSEPPPSPLLRNPDLQGLLLETRDLIAQTGTPQQPGQGELSRVGFVFAHAVCSIFGYINRKYELRERDEILRLRTPIEYEQRFGASASAGEASESWDRDAEDARVIHTGLTLRELSTALTPSSVGGARWARSLVSLGIDAGNDLGVVVPTTRYSESRNLAFRTYRIGETAHLADMPLREAFLEGAPDLLTAEGDAAQPITSLVVSVDSWLDEGFRLDATVTREENRDRRLADLEALIQKVFPGRIESHVEGRIDGVTDEFIEATITDINGEMTRARLNPAQISQSDRAKAMPGVMFTWTIFAADVNGARRRTSEVRLYPQSELDPEAMDRAERAFGYLAESAG